MRCRVNKKTKAHWSPLHWHLVSGEVGGWNLQVRGLHTPDVVGIFCDGPVTGKLAGAGNVLDDLLGPFLGVLKTEEDAE